MINLLKKKLVIFCISILVLSCKDNLDFDVIYKNGKIIKENYDFDITRSDSSVIYTYKNENKKVTVIKLKGNVFIQYDNNKRFKVEIIDSINFELNRREFNFYKIYSLENESNFYFIEQSLGLYKIIYSESPARTITLHSFPFSKLSENEICQINEFLYINNFYTLDISNKSPIFKIDKSELY